MGAFTIPYEMNTKAGACRLDVLSCVVLLQHAQLQPRGSDCSPDECSFLQIAHHGVLLH